MTPVETGLMVVIAGDGNGHHFEVPRVNVTLTSDDLAGLQQAFELMLSPFTAESPEKWLLGVMRVLKRVLKADSSLMRIPTSGLPHFITEDYGSNAGPDYFSYFSRFDPGRALSGPAPKLPPVWTVEDAYGDRLREFYGTEFFNDYQTPHRAFHGVCVSRKSGPESFDEIMYFHRARLTDPEFGDRGKAILRLFAPAFRAGLGAAQTWSSRAQALETVDNISDGCGLFALSGLLLHQNDPLCDLLTQDHGVALRSAVRATVDALSAIGWKTRRVSARPSDRRASREVLVGSARFTVAACFVGSVAGLAEPLILITVKRVVHGSAPHEPMVRSAAAFGLSARECQVAVLLAGRRTNAEISHRLGISVHTARHHTERVLNKLGVSRRTMVGNVLGRDPKDS